MEKDQGLTRDSWIGIGGALAGIGGVLIDLNWIARSVLLILAIGLITYAAIVHRAHWGLRLVGALGLSISFIAGSWRPIWTSYNVSGAESTEARPKLWLDQTTAEYVEADEPVIIDFSYKNIGDASAYDIHQIGTTLLQGRDRHDPIDPFYNEMKSKLDDVVKMSSDHRELPPNQTFHFAIHNLYPLGGETSTRREIYNYLKTGGRFYVLNLTSFKDKSGKTIYQEDCQFALLPSGFADCLTHNRVLPEK